MILLTILAIVGCPVTKVVNTSGLDWTKRDQHLLEFNSNSCQRWYGDSAPCLKVFEKYDHLAYRATCGAKL